MQMEIFGSSFGGNYLISGGDEVQKFSELAKVQRGGDSVGSLKELQNS